MHWYIIFVRVGREHKVVQFLKKTLDIDAFRPFILFQEVIFKTAGVVKRELKPLFPGYVFIESHIIENEFIKKTRNIFYSFEDIIFLLRYSDDEFALKESEKQVLINLCNDGNCIKLSRGIIFGDKMHITDGPLKGYESKVRSINRHKREANVEIEIMGDTQLVSVALEIVKKI